MLQRQQSDDDLVAWVTLQVVDRTQVDEHAEPRVACRRHELYDAVTRHLGDMLGGTGERLERAE